MNKKKLADAKKANNNVAVVNLDDNLYIYDMLYIFVKPMAYGIRKSNIHLHPFNFVK